MVMRPVARFGGFSPGIELSGIPNIGAEDNRLWLKATPWAADRFNRSETKANTGWRSPHDIFFSRLPDLQVGTILPGKHDAGGPQL